MEGETPEQFRERMRSVGYIGRRSGSQTQEGRTADGDRYKATTDELNNTVVEREGDRQDVIIRAPHLLKQTSTNEVR